MSQLRAARALLGWAQADLARALAVVLSTIRRMEGIDSPLRGNAVNVWKVQRALEVAAVPAVLFDLVRRKPGENL